MTAHGGVIALGLPGNQELLLLLVIGLLLFGRRLPEVGRAIGRTVTEFRRGLHTLKSEIDSDGSLRDARRGLEDLKRVVHAPRQLADPKRLFDRLTDESQASAGPDSTLVEPPPAESAIEAAAEDAEREDPPGSPPDPKQG